MEELIKAKMGEIMSSMAAINAADILHDFRPFLVVYKDGRITRIQRFIGTETVPAGDDSLTGVHSKDVVIVGKMPSKG